MTDVDIDAIEAAAKEELGREAGPWANIDGFGSTARFRAAANPAAVLALCARVREAEARVAELTSRLLPETHR